MTLIVHIVIRGVRIFNKYNTQCNIRTNFGVTTMKRNVDEMSKPNVRL